MGFDGYFNYGGTEIVNAARTAAYIHNLMPSFPLVRRTTIYDNLPAALGHEPYRTPFLDKADWVETDGADDPVPRNPTHGFYGLYPLSVEGIGDSTMSATVVEGILDGGAINSERDATRSIRIRGLLIGADELAVESGLTWLRNALRANSCGMHGDLCGYQDLRFFLAPPRIPLRRNLFVDRRPLEELLVRLRKEVVIAKRRHPSSRLSGHLSDIHPLDHLTNDPFIDASLLQLDQLRSRNVEGDLRCPNQRDDRPLLEPGTRKIDHRFVRQDFSCPSTSRIRSHILPQHFDRRHRRQHQNQHQK
jgi:hypothetical protein